MNMGTLFNPREKFMTYSVEPTRLYHRSWIVLKDTKTLAVPTANYDVHPVKLSTSRPARHTIFPNLEVRREVEYACSLGTSVELWFGS